MPLSSRLIRLICVAPIGHGLPQLRYGGFIPDFKLPALFLAKGTRGSPFAFILITWILVFCPWLDFNHHGSVLTKINQQVGIIITLITTLFITPCYGAYRLNIDAIGLPLASSSTSLSKYLISCISGSVISSTRTPHMTPLIRVRLEFKSGAVSKNC